MTNFAFSKHPFSNGKCLRRLMDEYEKYGSLVVGFDFDNTIYDTHGLGFDYSEVIELLRECKELGFTLCLYTAEQDEEHLKWKIEYCKEQGIAPDYVNESPLLNGTVKPFFSILLDDRASLETSWMHLKTVVEYAKCGRK